MSKLFKRAEKPSAAVQRAAMAQGMSLYFVKFLGKENVPEAKGAQVVDYALHQILTQNKIRKREGWHAPKVELSITQSGVKLTDRGTGHVFLDIPIRNVSYCQDDRRSNNIFCFIAKESPTAPKCCFAFKSVNQAADIMNAIGNAFARVSMAVAFNGQVTPILSNGRPCIRLSPVLISCMALIAVHSAAQAAESCLRCMIQVVTAKYDLQQFPCRT